MKLKLILSTLIFALMAVTPVSAQMQGSGNQALAYVVAVNSICPSFVKNIWPKISL